MEFWYVGLFSVLLRKIVRMGVVCLDKLVYGRSFLLMFLLTFGGK